MAFTKSQQQSICFDVHNLEPTLICGLQECSQVRELQQALELLQTLRSQYCLRREAMFSASRTPSKFSAYNSKRLLISDTFSCAIRRSGSVKANSIVAQ